MDLNFETDNYNFNARVSAIIYDETQTKVLLFKADDRWAFYMLPGGRIHLNEDSKTAISREIKEELDWNLDFSLSSIQEVFIRKDGKDVMQYCFCYKAIYKDYISEKSFKCLDNETQSFYWVNIDELDSLTVYPISSKKQIQEKDSHIKHIIEKQDTHRKNNI